MSLRLEYRYMNRSGQCVPRISQHSLTFGERIAAGHTSDKKLLHNFYARKVVLFLPADR